MRGAPSGAGKRVLVTDAELGLKEETGRSSGRKASKGSDGNYVALPTDGERLSEDCKAATVSIEGRFRDIR